MTDIAAPYEAGRPAALPVQPERALPPRPASRRGVRRRTFAHSPLIEEGGTPGLLRAAVLVLAGLVFACAGWASVARIETVVSGPGEVLSGAPPQRVQHPDGGVIAEVLVRDGQVVAAGQPLLRLDPAPSVAELEQMRARSTALQLQLERLRAFAERRAPDFSAVPGAAPELVADQQAIFENQERSRATQREVIERQMAQRRAELATLAEQEQRLRRTVGVLEEEAQMRNALFGKGLNSRQVVQDVERRLNEARAEANRTVGEQARTRQAVADSGQRLAEVDAILIRDAVAQIAQVSAEEVLLRDELGRRSSPADRLTVAAPVDGVVKAAAVAVGSLAAPGQELLQVIPIEDAMVVVARVEPGDAAAVREGQSVRVKVAGYDSVRGGTVDGRVEALLPASYVDERGQVYHRARIRLARNYVGPVAGRNPVMPGTAVEVEIATSDRTVLELLLRPGTP